MIAYQAGFDHAWDTGAQPYKRSMNPFTDPEQAKAFYSGYKEGCKDVAEHRQKQQPQDESSTSQAQLN
jgi:hypothetical protein